MGNASMREARQVWQHLLGEFFGSPVKEVEEERPAWAGDWDDLLDCAGHRLVVEYKVKADTASVSAAMEKLRPRLRSLPKGTHPILVVNKMGKTGSEICEREAVDWLDLAGNAKITHLPRTRIIIQGVESASRPRGRKSNVFATKSSRVAHWLLLHPDESHTHGQLAEITGLDKGHLSRILSRLDELRLIRRDGEGVIRLAKPAVLLDAWAEMYEPPCGRVLKGVIPSRSGQETMEILEEALRSARQRHVFGGLAAAWVWNPFADFRITTCYLEGTASPQLLKEMDFFETDSGANVWLMQEADEVAFQGSEERGQLNVASPWFTYVDLTAHPERSREAAAHLRESVLKLEEAHGS
jgi:DNA-binding transcriptional ArsR family regulator